MKRRQVLNTAAFATATATTLASGTRTDTAPSVQAGAQQHSIRPNPRRLQCISTSFSY
ncbi:MAG: hypothetical protein KME32_04805 [Mojavia pulchra JT2-VF2]|jgi:nitrous oxide reductase|uniref:Uncharacterized protein n=1 Tax=Mojavia pulchra JT2-VF2 TaxID=287848 RepID=A0A951PUI5_9NOST|nr:hypothetical protein [Mojavia pulchra JT2-VF2]